MNASGIVIAEELRNAWATLAPTVRFAVLAIRHESIVLDSTTDIQADLSTDLAILQSVLQESKPAYVLARLDDPPAHFLAITYVPDTASVRDKMLYASSRTALTKSLGAASFPDALFATSKADLTPAAYAAHLRHSAAPHPMSAQERERADARAAERAAALPPLSSRKSPLAAAGVQLRSTEDVESALAAFPQAEESTLVVLGIDSPSESLALISNAPCTPSGIGSSLPQSDPSYAFFSWHQPDRNDTIFIYSCPSASPIKHRMVFSSGVAAVLASAPFSVSKKIETSDPEEIDEPFLQSTLGLTTTNNIDNPGAADRKPFAKPRGPVRKQR